jgi:hypothetical protein
MAFGLSSGQMHSIGQSASFGGQLGRGGADNDPITAYINMIREQRALAQKPATAPAAPAAPVAGGGTGGAFGSTPAAPNQPGTPAPVAPRAPNANLPSDPVQAERGNKRPDYSLLDGLRTPGMGAAGAAKASVLSAVYRLPADGVGAARSLQAFNGKQGERLTLGR